MEEVKLVPITVKWSGKEYPIGDLTDQDTVAVLRHEIFKRTNVRPERQKLINLKHNGKVALDTTKLDVLELKPNFKLMMVGSTESAIEEVSKPPEDIDEVINDMEQNIEPEQAIEKSPIYLAKIEKRVKDYPIVEFQKPREGKRLLVLDIDYTLFDHRTPAETAADLMRPYLHEFLESAYQNYDIVIWSATNMRWIEEKMNMLGVSKHPRYKIMFYLDCNAMISLYSPDRGVVDVKPLGVIWGRYAQYSEKNTIMFDDIRRNFIMNPRSGLRIRAFRQANLNRATDRELLKLSKYLTDIAENCDDFTKLDHRLWEKYKPRE